MGKRRSRPDRGKKPNRAARSAPAVPLPAQVAAVEAFGWTILAHPLFLAQFERLVAAAESERSGLAAKPGPHARLLAHLLDLAFDQIPRDPAKPTFRHGGTLAGDRKHWFRAKTGNGRYRLFYRFQSAARIIVYASVNDEDSLRTYGSRTDTYAVFARMLDAGNPPDDWNALLDAASSPAALGRLGQISGKGTRTRK